MTLLINIQINLLFKRKFPIGLTSKFGNLVWPNARAALVLSVCPMFYTGFESLNSVDGLCRCPRTGSPEKKGSLRANILTCILKKKSPISNDNQEKTF
jgi:hypothetical protein